MGDAPQGDGLTLMDRVSLSRKYVKTIVPLTDASPPHLSEPGCKANPFTSKEEEKDDRTADDVGEEDASATQRDGGDPPALFYALSYSEFPRCDMP